jgi:signal transduction histidine kinase
LMSVLGLVNILQLENNQTSNEPYFDMMQSSIHKLDETLKEILEYSRNARSEINISEVSLTRMIDECFERLMYIQGSDTIVKNVKIEGEGTFFSDAYRVGLILSNLISNAIKYRDEKKPVSEIDILVSINTERSQIVFRDNGVGIQEDYLPKIFNMFFRATEKSEGAGLGLYIVKETIEKLQGTIRVTSVFGEGTTFFIQLPNTESGK